MEAEVPWREGLRGVFRRLFLFLSPPPASPSREGQAQPLTSSSTPSSSCRSSPLPSSSSSSSSSRNSYLSAVEGDYSEDDRQGALPLGGGPSRGGYVPLHAPRARRRDCSSGSPSRRPSRAPCDPEEEEEGEEGGWGEAERRLEALIRDRGYHVKDHVPRRLLEQRIMDNIRRRERIAIMMRNEAAKNAGVDRTISTADELAAAPSGGPKGTPGRARRAVSFARRAPPPAAAAAASEGVFVDPLRLQHVLGLVSKVGRASHNAPGGSSPPLGTLSKGVFRSEEAVLHAASSG